jgi:GntR family transcriptional regulator
MMAAETVMTVRTRTMTVARGKLTAQLGCRSGHRWLHLGCLKATAHQSRPLCWTDTFVDGRFASIVRAQDAFRSAVFGLIQKEAGETLVEIQQEIRAVILVNGEALRIAAAPGSPALEITRRYFSIGRRQYHSRRSLLLFRRDFERGGTGQAVAARSGRLRP